MNNAPIIESKVFLFGGLNVVSGLHWNTLGSSQTTKAERPKSVGSSVVFPAGKASRKLASDFHADKAVWRQSSDQNPVQVGIAQSENIKGGKGTYYSFASLALEALALHDAESAETSCLAVEDPENEGLYFLVMQYKGNLVPGGDAYGPADIIAQAINENASTGGFSIFAPDSLGIHGSMPLPEPSVLLEAIGSAGLEAHKLSALKPSARRILIFFAALAVVGLIAFLANNEYQKSIQLEKDRAAREAMAKLISGNKVPDTEPMVSVVDPAAFFSICTNEFNKQNLFAGGWAFRDAECSHNTLTIYFNRNNSTVEYLAQKYNNATFSNDGEQASVTIDIHVDSREIEVAELLDSATVLRGLNNYWQTTGATAVIQADKKERTSLPGRKSAEEEEEEAFSVKWVITLPILGSLEKLKVKGSSLDNVHLTSKEGILIMTLKGKTYANR